MTDNEKKHTTDDGQTGAARSSGVQQRNGAVRTVRRPTAQSERNTETGKTAARQARPAGLQGERQPHRGTGAQETVRPARPVNRPQSSASTGGRQGAETGQGAVNRTAASAARHSGVQGRPSAVHRPAEASGATHGAGVRAETTGGKEQRTAAGKVSADRGTGAGSQGRRPVSASGAEQSRRTGGTAGQRPAVQRQAEKQSSGQMVRASQEAGRRDSAGGGTGSSGGGSLWMILGGIFLLALIVAAAIFFVMRKGESTSQETSGEVVETTAFDADVIQTDLYLDYSAFSSDGDTTLLNMKGMTREQVADAVKAAYQWDLKVVNTNPNLDAFEMPELQEAEAVAEAEETADAAADNEGTAQEIKVEDPLSAVTIRPSKSEFAVPDLLAENLTAYVEQIFTDYREKAEASLAAGTAAEESSSQGEDATETSSAVRQADYVLAKPDVSEQLTDYVSQLALLWNVTPKNGEISSYDASSDKFVFGGSVQGYSLDEAKLVEELQAAIDAGEYSKQIESTGSVTEASSASATSQYKTIGTFTTKTTSNQVRNKNIDLACKAINGHILRPGEEFSFNDVVGQRTEEKGYGKAAAYSSGEVVQEVGGGICQVSTTLYNAVFRSGLTTTYRRSHTFEPSYVTPGLDATVSWGGPDYKFVNSSNYTIGIKASYSNQTCTVSIYGIPVLEDGVTWELSSTKTKSDIEPPTSIIESGTPTNGSYGSEWQVYKVIKKNGTEVERVKDHTSSYKGHTRTVLSEAALAASSAAAASSQAAEASSESGTEMSGGDVQPVLPDSSTAQTSQQGPGEGPGAATTEATTASGLPVPTTAQSTTQATPQTSAAIPVPTTAASLPVPTTTAGGPGEAPIIQEGS